MKKEEPFSVVFEDARILAVSKASGISTGGDRWDTSQVRLDHLLGGHLFAVHRIDKETSGLVVFAKDEKTRARLCGAFERRTVEKNYIALVSGRPAWRETSCELGLLPDGNKKHQTIIDKGRGKKARTTFTVLCAAGNYAALRAQPHTGRTHQIRVSLAYLRHPVMCDALYGSAKPLFLSAFKRNWRGDRVDERPLLARLGLHAAGLRFDGWPPFEAPLPKDMKAALCQMEKQGERYE